jgi:hypothetical protein
MIRAELPSRPKSNRVLRFGWVYWAGYERVVSLSDRADRPWPDLLPPSWLARFQNKPPPKRGLSSVKV